MSDASYTLCPLCGMPVDPDEPGAIYAASIANEPGFGQQNDFIDGRRGFFHATCPPENLGWQRRQLPGPASAA